MLEPSLMGCLPTDIHPVWPAGTSYIVHATHELEKPCTNPRVCQAQVVYWRLFWYMHPLVSSQILESDSLRNFGRRPHYHSTLMRVRRTYVLTEFVISSLMRSNDLTHVAALCIVGLAYRTLASFSSLLTITHFNQQQDHLHKRRPQLLSYLLIRSS